MAADSSPARVRGRDVMSEKCSQGTAPTLSHSYRTHSTPDAARLSTMNRACSGPCRRVVPTLSPSRVPPLGPRDENDRRNSATAAFANPSRARHQSRQASFDIGGFQLAMERPLSATDSEPRDLACMFQRPPAMGPLQPIGKSRSFHELSRVRPLSMLLEPRRTMWGGSAWPAEGSRSKRASRSRSP